MIGQSARRHVRMYDRPAGGRTRASSYSRLLLATPTLLVDRLSRIPSMRCAAAAARAHKPCTTQRRARAGRLGARHALAGTAARRRRRGESGPAPGLPPAGGIDGGGYTFDRRQLLRTTIDVPAACACIAFLTLHGRRIDSRLSCVHAFLQSWLLLFDVPRASAS